MPLTQYI